MMSKIELADWIRTNAMLSGDFLLRSGARSNTYFDKYRITSRPEVLRSIAQHMGALIEPQLNGVNFLAGLEMGAIPLATALSLETGLPAVFVRKAPKPYGTCQFAEGADIQGQKLLVLEDVVTSGGQLIESVADLKKAGARVVGAACIILRSPEKKSDIESKIGVPLLSLFLKSEVD